MEICSKKIVPRIINTRKLNKIMRNKSILTNIKKILLNYEKAKISEEQFSHQFIGVDVLRKFLSFCNVKNSWVEF